MTSPPYWGLRDYGTATWEGGDAECDHKERVTRQSSQARNEWAPNSTRAIRIGPMMVRYRRTVP